MMYSIVEQTALKDLQGVGETTVRALLVSTFILVTMQTIPTLKVATTLRCSTVISKQRSRDEDDLELAQW